MFLISGLKAKRVPINKYKLEEVNNVIVLKKETDITNRTKDFW